MLKSRGASLPKNESSQDTHPPCRAPFLGYTGVIPLLINSQNTPDYCTHSLPKKRVLQGYPLTLQGTHIAPLKHPWGRTHVLGPCLWQRSAAGCPETPILGPTGALSPKVSLKTSFPWVPTRRVEYPHCPSTIAMGSHSCAWPRS